MTHFVINIEFLALLTRKRFTLAQNINCVCSHSRFSLSPVLVIPILILFAFFLCQFFPISSSRENKFRWRKIFPRLETSEIFLLLTLPILLAFCMYDFWELHFITPVFILYLFLVLILVYGRKFAWFSSITLYLESQFCVPRNVSNFWSIFHFYFLSFLCLSFELYRILFREQCCQLLFAVIQNFANSV